MKTSLLNLLLIALSLFLAIFLPFEVFLIAYAVLGPLHYITEINWLKSKNYFTTNRYWVLVCLISSLFIVLPKLISLINKKFNAFEDLNNTLQVFNEYTNNFIFLLILIALLPFIKGLKKHKIVLIVLCFLASLFFKNSSFFTFIIGVLLITLVHVYLFSILFMIYGYKKKASVLELLNIILVICIPIIIFLVPIDYVNQVSKITYDSYISSGFYILNAKIAGFLGYTNGNEFNFVNNHFVKVQIFITFAYLNHYFNWFAKTTQIKWHKLLSFKKVISIISIWLVSVFLYWYDYKIGLTALLFLSLLHVFLEFPLNIKTIKNLFSSL